MQKIITIKEAIEITRQLRSEGKKIILTGGCFDILHLGHITYLENSKKLGDVLLIFLESDKKIKKIKGPDRPINSQKDRARILAALSATDFIILLAPDLTDSDYTNMILDLKPDIITITKGDIHEERKKNQAQKINAEVINVTEIISDQSTTRLIKLLGNEL